MSVFRAAVRCKAQDISEKKAENFTSIVSFRRCPPHCHILVETASSLRTERMQIQAKLLTDRGSRKAGLAFKKYGFERKHNTAKNR
jgi:hypothetical protein